MPAALPFWRRCWNATPSKRVVDREGRLRWRATSSNWRTVFARDAEAVCRHYLSNGRREGRYWLVGDVRNTPGRSLFVRLKGQARSLAKVRARKMDRRRHGRTWRSPRRHQGSAAAFVNFHDVAGMKHDASSACRDWSQSERRRIDRRQCQPDRRNRRGGSSLSRSPLRSQSRKRICVIAALQICPEPEASAFTPAATIGQTRGRRRRPGRR